MAIQQRPPGSIFLTLKVVQAVNQLRRHLKPRVSGFSTKESILGSKTCLGLETAALRSIEKGLSRVSPQSKRQLHQPSNRVCKSRKGARPSLNVQTAGRDGSVVGNTSSEQMEHVLKSLDGNISPALTTGTCSDDKLFLLKQNEVSFEGCTLNETIQSLVLVYNAIGVLREVRSTYDDEFLIAQGLDFGLNIDEKFIANYSHILLSLQAQLLETLARKVVEALIENDLDKRQRRLLDWLISSAELPHDKHLLSTTWPWSLKPSLAVLWGVCWMFYYPDQQRNRKGRNERVHREAFLHQLPWEVPDPDSYLQFGLELLGTQAQPAAQQQTLLRPSGGGFPDGEAALAEGAGALSALGVGALDGNLAADQFGAGPGGVPARTYASSPLTSRGFHTSPDFFDPGNSGIPIPLPPSYHHQQDLVAYTQHFLDDDDFSQPWHQQLTQRSSPLGQHSHSSAVSVPDLRVNGTTPEAQSTFAAPQQFDAAFIYQHQHPQARQQQLGIDTNLQNYTQQHFAIMGGHERNDSVNSTSNMPTPISLAETRSPPALLSPSGPRRPSSASSHGHLAHSPDRPSSEDGDNDDDTSPRRNHSYKRAEEPPRNTENKMVCKHQECANLTFDRKCEWSKHMDKHDRPYKCVVKGCEKLQGFTYSGGLLRHEREVHKMHGGTKKSLYCPFADCKRSSGSGFTRKENLAEHIRRVHRRTSMSSDLGHLIINRSDTLRDDVSESRLSPDAPYRRGSEIQDDSLYSLKRKRVSDAGISEEGDETDLRSEVKRLRGVLEQKDARLAQLEQAVMALQQDRR